MKQDLEFQLYFFLKSSFSKGGNHNQITKMIQNLTVAKSYKV